MLSLECVLEQMEQGSSACSDHTPEDPFHHRSVMLLIGEVLCLSVSNGAGEEYSLDPEILIETAGEINPSNAPY